MANLANLIQTEEPMRTDACALYPYSVDLQKKFTLTSNFGDVYKMFERRGDYIALPRELAPVSENDKRTTGRALKCKTRIKPKNSEQERVINEATDLLMDGNSFLLRAGTGFGKTVCALEIAARIGRPVLIVVPKEDLYDQWLKAIKKFWMIPDNKIGRIRQDVCDVAGKDIVVGMLHSMCIPDRYPKHIYDAFGLVVFDECHRLAADSFMTICNKLTAKLRLGLSATPKRKDGKDIVLHAHIGPIRVETDLVQLAPKVLRYNTAWKCPRVKAVNPRTGETEYRKIKHTPGKTMHLMKRMCRDPERNEMLLKFVKASYNKGRDIIVFTDLREHVDLLINLSIKMGMPASDIAPYVSGMKKNELEAAKNVRIRFTTWGMMSEGTDIPWADTCIFGTPRSNIEQALGRILREYPDKKIPICFDLIDADSPVFRGYADKRVAVYKKKNAEIKTMA